MPSCKNNFHAPSTEGPFFRCPLQGEPPSLAPNPLMCDYIWGAYVSDGANMLQLTMDRYRTPTDQRTCVICHNRPMVEGVGAHLMSSQHRAYLDTWLSRARGTLTEAQRALLNDTEAACQTWTAERGDEVHFDHLAGVTWTLALHPPLRLDDSEEASSPR